MSTNHMHRGTRRLARRLARRLVRLAAVVFVVAAVTNGAARSSEAAAAPEPSATAGPSVALGAVLVDPADNSRNLQTLGVFGGIACPGTTCWLTATNVAVPFTAGTFGAGVPLGASGFNPGPIACATEAFCALFGEESNGGPYFGQALVAGEPGTLVPAPGGFWVAGAACPAAGQCTAVGFVLGPAPVDGYPTGEAAYATFSGTAFGPLVVLPAPVFGAGSALSAVACPSSSACVAVGYAAVGNPVVLPVSAGSAGTPSVVPGSTPDPGLPYGGFDAVACPTVSDCYVGGYVEDPYSNPTAAVATYANGALGPVALVPASEGVTGIACPDADVCVATESNPDEAIGTGALVLDAGSPGPVAEGSAGTAGATPWVACTSASQCWDSGATDADGYTEVPTVQAVALDDPAAYAQDAGATGGYDLAASDGGVFAYGDAGFWGSAGSTELNAPIVGTAAAPGGKGYWLVAADGGVFTYGDAGFYGSAGALPLVAPVVGMAATPDGKGYWLVAADGGIFTYGDAPFYGSIGGRVLNEPVVGMAAAPDGKGYWFVAADGGVFAYGDASFWGSLGGQAIPSPVVGMASTGDAGGYYLAAADGAVWDFGDATAPSAGASTLGAPVVAIAVDQAFTGYYLVSADGGVAAYGAAGYQGSASCGPLAAPVVAIAVTS